MAAESWCASPAYLLASHVCSSIRVPNPVSWKGLKAQLTLHLFSLHCTEVSHPPLCHEILETLESRNKVELDSLLFSQSGSYRGCWSLIEAFFPCLPSAVNQGRRLTESAVGRITPSVVGSAGPREAFSLNSLVLPIQPTGAPSCQQVPVFHITPLESL